MILKVPTNLEEAIIAIAELQTAANWNEGQVNLLQSFILSSPDKLSAFATYSSEVLKLDDPNAEQMKHVAKTLLDGGLAQYLPTEELKSSAVVKQKPELRIVK